VSYRYFGTKEDTLAQGNTASIIVIISTRKISVAVHPLEVLYLTLNDRYHRHFDPLFHVAFILSALVCIRRVSHYWLMVAVDHSM